MGPGRPCEAWLRHDARDDVGESDSQSRNIGTHWAGLRQWFFALLAVTLLAALPVLAVEPDQIHADRALEARARHISEGLRCLVCQNQSIDDSNAPLARDLRLLVRERLKAGDSDAEVMQFVEDRYGEFVLLRPPFDVRTLLLWLAPLLVLLAAIAVALRVFRQRAGPAPAAAALTSAEEERLRALLADADTGATSQSDEKR